VGERAILSRLVTKVTKQCVESIEQLNTACVEKSVVAEFTYGTFNCAVGTAVEPFHCADSS
jgi:hypothetical protein